MRRGDEPPEQRMRLVRFAVEFRMELAGNEKRMFCQLYNLHQLPIRRKSTEDQARFLEFLAICVVKFVTMSMALVDNKCAVKPRSLRTHDKLARLRAQAHRAAFFGDALLLIQ